MTEQKPINFITIHPVFDRATLSMEHFEGQFDYSGDALGRDCMVARFIDGFTRTHTGDGSKNEDWFTWNADVLAPFDSEVVRITENNVTNKPTFHENTPAATITFKNSDDVHVIYAHVKDVNVKVGDKVKSGQIVAKGGNNGTSYHPHIHVGAWKGAEHLQIRFDLRLEGKIVERVGRPYLFDE